MRLCTHGKFYIFMLFLPSMKYFLLFALLAISIMGYSQSKAMRNFSDIHDDAFTLVFYYSTLKMWIPEDDVELKAIIRDLEKIKLLRIDEEELDGKAALPAIKSDLVDEGYEEALVMKGPGRNMMVYINEKNGKQKGIFMMLGEDSSITILDIIGSIPIDKLLTLQNKIETLTEDGSFLQNFRNNKSN